MIHCVVKHGGEKGTPVLYLPLVDPDLFRHILQLQILSGWDMMMAANGCSGWGMMTQGPYQVQFLLINLCPPQTLPAVVSSTRSLWLSAKLHFQWIENNAGKVWI